ncbi:MAG: YfhO family protein [Burkholderiales bacterium]
MTARPARLAAALRDTGRPGFWIALLAGLCAFYAAYFAPALYRGTMLAPGDGILYYYPFFIAPIQLWTPLMLAGYAVIGDPQAQVLYPLRLLAPTFDVFVMTAYVVAGAGMFGLSLALTRSRIAALCAALVMSGSGFMIAHLGHVSIVHAAAWVPAILWACVAVSEAGSGKPVVLGALAVALSLLGGHPQATIMGLLLAGAFAAYLTSRRWRERGRRDALVLALRFLAMFALGAMLAAPMLLPAAQAAAESVRTTWTRQDFNSFRHSPLSLRMLAFPNMYGAITEGPYGGYAGPGSPTELAVYVGFLPLFLAIAALGDREHRKAILFWAAACVIGFILTMGTFTPLGELLYHMPVLGRFRAQARFGLVTTIALSVLAAYGIAALRRSPPSRSRGRALLLAAAGLSLLFVLSVALSPPTYPGLPTKSWTHPALWTAPVLMLVAIAAFALMVMRPGARSAAIVVVVAVVDVASFGWFYEWRYVPAVQARPTLDAESRRVVEGMAAGEGRVFPVDASSMSPNPLRPNMNLTYGIASVVGYTPLLPQRYATFAGADTAGNLPPLAPSVPLMDVLAVRWFAGGANSPATQLLGGGCGVASDVRRMRALLPPDATGTLRIVSHMACAQRLTTGSPVATVRVIEADGTSRIAGALRAGIETAEWAYDRPDIRAAIAHARPPVADTFPADGVTGLWFAADIPVSAPGERRAMVEIMLDDGVALPLRLRSVEFVHAGTGQRQALALTPAYPGEEDQLTTALRLPPLPPLSERLRYKGMVWAVCRAQSVPAVDLALRLRARAEPGVAPAFDPLRDALIETGIGVPELTCKEAPDVEVRSRSTRSWRLDVSTRGSGLLVVSERYDPGWRARVDGVAADVIPVDGLVLGVRVPDGEHRVELRYAPRWFGLSIALCVLAAAACAWPFIGKFFRSRRPGRAPARRA